MEPCSPEINTETGHRSQYVPPLLMNSDNRAEFWMSKYKMQLSQIFHPQKDFPEKDKWNCSEDETQKIR